MTEKEEDDDGEGRGSGDFTQRDRRMDGQNNQWTDRQSDLVACTRLKTLNGLTD